MENLNTHERLLGRHRALSVQRAMDDPRLASSLQDLSKSNKPSNNPTRLLFEKKVRRYYYQLLQGCGDVLCNHKLCASNLKAPKLNSQLASVMAVQLANHSKNLVCPRLPADLDLDSLPFSLSPFGTPKGSPQPTRSHSRQNSSQKLHHPELETSAPKPFLHTLLSYSPFNNIFNSDESVGPKSAKSDRDISPTNKARSNSETSIESLLLKRYNDANSTSKLSKMSSQFDSMSSIGGSVPTTPSVADSMFGGGFSNLWKTITPNPSGSEENQDLATLAAEKLNLEFEKQNTENISLKYLTMELLSLTIENYKATKTDTFGSECEGDPTLLLNTIRSVFSSLEAMSLSFTLKSSKNPHASQLDVVSITQAYNLILQLEPATVFQNSLMDAVEILVSKLNLNMKQLQLPKSPLLRILLMLLLNPLMQTIGTHDSVIGRFLSIMGSIRSQAKSTLIIWFSELPKEQFSSIVKGLQQYINIAGPPGLVPDDSYIGAVKTLSMLSHANEFNHGPIIEPSDFYMTELTSRLNFKEEFRKWRKTLESDVISDFALFNYPFLFDPVSKTRIIHIDAMVKMSHEYEDACANQALVFQAQKFLDESDALNKMESDMKASINPYLVLEIRRSHFVSDVLDQISIKTKDLKKPLKIKFVGGGEEGMDQGGVQKEFFQVLVSKLLDPDFGMFVYDTDTRYSWINHASLEPSSKFELIGIMLGLALYNGVMVQVGFPPIMYKKLLKEEITLSDVKIAFPALGNGLQQLLDWSDGDVSDVFMRTFEISYESFGQVTHIPLIPDGENIFVTNDNRVEYVRLYIQHYCTKSIEKQFRYFQHGFYKVCGGKALGMCRSFELELLLCGNNTTELDFRELEEGTTYEEFSKNHYFIIWFWEIVYSFNINQKRFLLEFVTASDRVPLKGLGSLQFVIQRNGPDTDRLPSALTCFGRLLLPEYSTRDKLKERLLTAIENAKGFGLV
ncbi:hypothetical protein BC833DRAFT_605853 [Globomyces pollinis-pini]|nr:hypothetical protein BC833DRAFT_605853 [Globomyces pollinis-pini]